MQSLRNIHCSRIMTRPVRRILLVLVVCVACFIVFERALLSDHLQPFNDWMRFLYRGAHASRNVEPTRETNVEITRFKDGNPVDEVVPEVDMNRWARSKHIILPPNLRFVAKPVVASVKPSATKKLIVIFNRPDWLFRSDPHFEHVYDTCPYTCTMTDDKAFLPQADAVWVDVCRLNAVSPPPNRPSNQMWVAYSIESPVHYSGYHNSPAWKSVFNRTFSYRTDSDFFRPYGEFALRDAPVGKDYKGVARGKTKPVAWFVSNCHSSSQRERYVEELKKHIEVDVYGNCGTFVCPGLEEKKCFRILNDTYYFYLAFENSFCQDYVTEKLFKTYNNVDIIPVVRGGTNYSQFLPPDTYINAADFATPKDLAQYLLALMEDVDRYTAMLHTKDHFFTSFDSWYRPNIKPFCKMCQMLQTSPPPPKVYPDIMEWTERDKCWASTDIN